MRRGDLYWAQLHPRSGSEQRGRRPVVILSSDGFNEVSTWRSVIVVPVTTSPRQALRGPTVVPLTGEPEVLKPTSIAICHQITTLDRSKLTAKLGAVSPREMAAIERAILAACDIGN